MMPSVTFILGLCGSGKSWLANHISADIKFDEGFWLSERRAANVAALVATLRGGGNALVVEVEFCLEAARQQILEELSVVPGIAVHWICIENELRTANENCRRRKNHGNADTQVQINEQLSLNYTYPDGAEIRPMWSDSPADAVVAVGEAKAFSSKQVDDFVALVLAGGEVEPNGLRQRVLAAPQLAFLRQGDCLVGVGGLKSPSAAHRHEVESGSNVALPIAQVPFELGWVFILPSARNRKFSLPLCRQLIAAAGNQGVFATSRVTNSGMHRTLEKLGFSRQGAEWHSHRSNDNLALFVRRTA
jgi:hypothetical protein